MISLHEPKQSATLAIHIILAQTINVIYGNLLCNMSIILWRQVTELYVAFILFCCVYFEYELSSSMSA